MAKKDSVNVSIFSALKVGEKAKNVPVLLMSNPGMGKTTTVAIFAEHRGYHLQLLKGNSTSETEIIGYDVVPTLEMKESGLAPDVKTTVHLRPSWFSQILEKEKQGIPSLLFLDEITTAPEHVQAALLQLVFERKVGDEDLPESTLVVAAGNYIQNLSNQMNLIPPLMNRFLIYNITADDTDLDSFLCKYKGAISSPDGKTFDNIENLRKILEEMDNKAVNVDEQTENKIGEYIERQIKETARALMKSGEKPLSFKVTDLQSIYGDTIEDQKLYGFATLRTLGYLVDVSLASYLCFGKAGLTSDSYENMIDGLVGYGVSREKSGGEVKKTLLTPEFKESMKSVANEIDKMNNSAVPKYEEFLKQVLAKKTKSGTWDIPELQSTKVKVEEILGDKSLKGIERPIASVFVTDILEIIAKTVNNIGIDNLKVNTATIQSDSFEQDVPPEKVAAVIHKWNAAAGLFGVLEKFINVDGIGYKEDVTEAFSKAAYDCRMTQFKIAALKKVLAKRATGYEKIIPDCVQINTPSTFTKKK